MIFRITRRGYFSATESKILQAIHEGIYYHQIIDKSIPEFIKIKKHDKDGLELVQKVQNPKFLA